MWPFRPRCSLEQAMEDGIDFAIGWHEKSFALIGRTMRQAGEPELGIEIFINETEAALCACALATAAMVPSPTDRRRLSDAARKRVDERTGCLLAFDAYLPAIDAIDGDSDRFSDLFFRGLPEMMLARLDAGVGETDERTRDRLAEIFRRVGGDVMRWTAEHRKKHRVF